MVWYFFNIISVRCTYGIESVSIHVFIYLSIHPSIGLFTHHHHTFTIQPINQPINQSNHVISLSIYPCFHLSACRLSIHLYMDPSISPSIYLSIYEFIYLPIYLRARMYIYKYKYINIHIYIYIYTVICTFVCICQKNVVYIQYWRTIN